MRDLRSNTATRVTVGPFFDKTDGITPETALTATNEKLTFIVDDGGVPTLVIDASATASGGNNDLVHISGDDAGFYDLELTAAQLNYVGRAMLAITDAANHCPVWHEFSILPQGEYDAKYTGAASVVGTVTSDAGNTATAFKTSLTSYASDYWNDALILFTSGALVGQVKKVGDFATTTGLITLAGSETFTATPSGGDAFVIINR